MAASPQQISRALRDRLTSARATLAYMRSINGEKYDLADVIAEAQRTARTAATEGTESTDLPADVSDSTAPVETVETAETPETDLLRDLGDQSYGAVNADRGELWLVAGPGSLDASATRVVEPFSNIQTDDFYAISQGVHPVTGEALAPANARRSVGSEFEFRAPKGVSIYWGLADDATRREIETFLFRASKETLDYAVKQGLIKSRAGSTREGHLDSEPLNQVLAAGFVHHTNRYADPDLHLHGVILNSGGVTREGEYRSVDARQFQSKAAQELLQARFQAALASRLQQRFGFNFTVRDQQSIEMAGWPAPVLERLSKSSDEEALAAAEAYAAARIRESGQTEAIRNQHRGEIPTARWEAEIGPDFPLKTLRAKAEKDQGQDQPDASYSRTLASYLKLSSQNELLRAKHGAESPRSALDALARSKARQKQQILDDAKAITPPVADPATKLLAEAMALQMRHSSVVDEQDLLKQAYSLGAERGIDPNQIDAAFPGFRSSDKIISGVVQQADAAAIEEGRRSLTTKAALHDEIMIASAARGGLDRVDNLSYGVDRVLAAQTDVQPGAGVPDDIVDVAKRTLAGDRVTVLRGSSDSARSGAIVLLMAAAQAANQRPVLLTPDRRAGGADPVSGLFAENLSDLLSNPDLIDQIDKRSVIVVDQAHRMGREDAAKLLRIVEYRGARVILHGDPAKSQAQTGGSPLSIIERQVSSSRVVTRRKQQEDWMHAATLQGAQYRVDKMMESYLSRGAVTFGDGQKDVVKRAADAFMELDRPGQQTLAIASRNETVHQINAEIRSRLIDSGQLQDVVGVEQVRRNGNGGKSTLADLEIRIGDRLSLQAVEALGIREGEAAVVKGRDQQGRYQLGLLGRDITVRWADLANNNWTPEARRGKDEVAASEAENRASYGRGPVAAPTSENLWKWANDAAREREALAAKPKLGQAPTTSTATRRTDREDAPTIQHGYAASVRAAESMTVANAIYADSGNSFGRNYNIAGSIHTDQLRVIVDRDVLKAKLAARDRDRALEEGGPQVKREYSQGEIQKFWLGQLRRSSQAPNAQDVIEAAQQQAIAALQQGRTNDAAIEQSAQAQAKSSTPAALSFPVVSTPPSVTPSVTPEETENNLSSGQEPRQEPRPPRQEQQPPSAPAPTRAPIQTSAPIAFPVVPPAPVATEPPPAPTPAPAIDLAKNAPQKTTAQSATERVKSFATAFAASFARAFRRQQRDVAAQTQSLKAIENQNPSPALAPVARAPGRETPRRDLPTPPPAPAPERIPPEPRAPEPRAPEPRRTLPPIAQPAPRAARVTPAPVPPRVQGEGETQPTPAPARQPSPEPKTNPPTVDPASAPVAGRDAWFDEWKIKDPIDKPTPIAATPVFARDPGPAPIAEPTAPTPAIPSLESQKMEKEKPENPKNESNTPPITEAQTPSDSQKLQPSTLAKLWRFSDDRAEPNLIRPDSRPAPDVVAVPGDERSLRDAPRSPLGSRPGANGQQRDGLAVFASSSVGRPGPADLTNPLAGKQTRPAADSKPVAIPAEQRGNTVAAPVAAPLKPIAVEPIVVKPAAATPSPLAPAPVRARSRSR